MTYVFRCASCRHEFEIIASVAEYESSGAPACPRCRRAGSRRVFTAIAVMSGAGTAAPAPASGRTGSGRGDGCCGGACGCGH